MKLQVASLILLLASPTSHAFVPHRYRAARPFLKTTTTTTTMTTARDATVKRLPDSAVEIEIQVPGEATKAAYDRVCTELSKKIHIPGFRKGSRIPPQVLEQRMAANGGKNALKVQAINQLLSRLVESAFKEESLEPIGQPSLIIPAEDLADNYIPGEELVLPIRCDVWPDIKWKGGDRPYVGLTGKYTRKPFNQERMGKVLSDLRERYVTNVPIADSDYVLAMGDACTVNMVGFMATPSGEKGDPLPNAASGDRVEVVLGSGRYMEGLVEGLIGAKVGETRQVSVSFPAKLRDKTLAGKRAIFDVEVLEASKRVMPEVTDEFAAKVRPGLTAEALDQELRKAIDQEDAKEYAPARNKALAEALSAIIEVEVPDTLVTNQAREKFAVMMADMREGGVSDEEIKRQINPENFNKYKNIVKDDIIRDFKVSMATDEIARLEGITVPDYKIEEQMEAIRKDAAESKENFDEKVIRAKVEATMTRSAVYDWLAENSNLEVEFEEEEGAGFDEALMQQLADETAAREQKMAAGEAPAAVEEAVEVKNETPAETLVQKLAGETAALEQKMAAGKVPVAVEEAVEETPAETLVQKLADETEAREQKMAAGEAPAAVEKAVEETPAETLVQKLADETAAREQKMAAGEAPAAVEEAVKVEEETPAETLVQKLADETAAPEQKMAAGEAPVAVEEAVKVEEETRAEPDLTAPVEVVAELGVREEQPVAVVEEPAPAAEADKSKAESDDDNANRYAKMSLQDRAFQILSDLGMAGGIIEK